MLNRIIGFLDGHKVTAALVLVVALGLVLFPRFNRQDVGLVPLFTGTAPYERNCDNQSYFLFTEYYKGNVALHDVAAPFCYRPLTPFLSSLLPFDSFTSLNLFNALMILLCAPVTLLIAKKLGYSYGIGIVGSALHFVSFPVFYYGTSGFVEPLSILMLYLFILFRLHRNNIALIALFAISAWAKETTIVVSAYLLVDIYFSPDSKKTKDYAAVVIGSAFFVGEIFFIRAIYTNFGAQMAWVPDTDILISNLLRAKTYFTFVVSFGITGIIALYMLVNRSKYAVGAQFASYYAGIMCAFALFAYAILTAYSDGRFIWPSIPFACVLSMHLIGRQEN